MQVNSRHSGGKAEAPRVPRHPREQWNGKPLCEGVEECSWEEGGDLGDCWESPM